MPSTSADPRHRPLEGKVALVTGGGKGIGRAICLRLAGMGASVGLTASTDMESAMRTAEEVRGLGSSAWVGGMDLAYRQSVDTAVAGMVATLGRLDMVINNAGVSRRGRLLDLSTDDLDHVFAVHARGFFHVATAAARQMISQAQGGNIIAIAGASALRCYAGNGAYGPSKAAVLSFVRQMAVEWSPDGIRVNAVLPGPVRDEGEDWRNTEPVLVKQVKKLPIQRVGKPAEIADAVAYLTTAEYVTGQDIVVDGGSTTTWYLDND